MKRRLIPATAIAILLAITSMATLAAQPAQAHPSTFPDVPETSKAHEAIESLAADGIVSGFEDGAFHPDAPLTRAQATKMLASWRGLTLAASGPASPSRFPDVDNTYSPYVDAAVAAGWVSGFVDGTFRPGASLTREQMAIVITRGLGLDTAAKSLSAYRIDTALAGFLDEQAISSDARRYTALAVMKGLFTGDASRLNPLDTLTRAQFSLVLFRAEALLAQRVSDASAPAADGASGDHEAYAPQELALADFIDRYLLQPHHSPITGLMVLQNANWYGIPPLSQLVIMSAETSLGDPDLGGLLARHNNFGCLRYHGTDTPWGLLSDGRIWAAGKDWYSFPSAGDGMAAFGRYLKMGADGFYVPILTAAHPDWRRFAAVYYGSGVSGFGSYVDRLYAIEKRFREMAAERGLTF